MHASARWIATALLAPAALLLGGGTAPSEAISDCQIQQRWAGQIITAESVQLPSGWSWHMECGTNQGAGYTNAETHTVTIRPQHAVVADQVRLLWLHEAGHAWDAAVLGANDRGVWRRLRGVEDGDWSVPTSSPDWSRAAGEDFAMSFAWCHRNFAADWWMIEAAAPPTASECRVMQDLTGVR